MCRGRQKAEKENVIIAHNLFLFLHRNLDVEGVEGKGEAAKDADKNPDAKAGPETFNPGAHGQAGGVKSLTIDKLKHANVEIQIQSDYLSNKC